MLKQIFLSTVIIANAIFTFDAYARVTFIIGEDEDYNSTKSKNLEDNAAEACRRDGFPTPVSSCTGNTRPGHICYHSPKYTDQCCAAKYSYNVITTCPSGTVPSSQTCGGRHACVCPPEYGYGIDRNKCIGSFSYDYSEICYEKYYTSDGTYVETPYFKGCICPNNYATCSSEYNLKGAGDVCNYKGVNYYTNCVCHTGYNKRCSKYNDPVDPNDYCKLNGIKYYKACKDPTENEKNDKSDSDTMGSTEQ